MVERTPAEVVVNGVEAPGKEMELWYLPVIYIPVAPASFAKAQSFPLADPLALFAQANELGAGSYRA